MKIFNLFKTKKRYEKSRCEKCKKQCPLYKNSGKLLREAPLRVYQSARELLEMRKKITLVELQRELKIGYPLASSIMDKLTLDGFLSCLKYGTKRKIMIERKKRMKTV